jgi:TAG lipase/steryl ester hydrolase/phospholipase A2/LPA acyltransferase
MRNPPRVSPPLIAQRRKDLAHASDYRSWREIAQELDRLEGADVWKQDDTSDDYDYLLIKERLSEMRELRRLADAPRLAFKLGEGLHGNLGNLSNPALYGVARVGTKQLIEDYITEVARCLDFLCAGDFANFPLDEKVLFFKRTGTAFGRSALMLSGGATLGMFHLGVVKALHEQNLLPRVISGSSAGSLMAGTIGTHTDAELSGIFEPGGFDITAFQRVALRQLVKGQSLMDPAQLRRCLAVNVGDETFLEAFERTRRIIGVTISPADPHHQGRLMNYLTSPHVLIHKAVMASCAVPGVFPPVMLEARDYENNVVPYMPSKRWIDGTLSNDLPMLRVARLHNVNHYIVSQTNPHIVPFVTESVSNEQKRGWAPLSKELLVNGSRGAMTLARKHLDPYGSGRVINKIDDIMRQRYSGDINIIPRHTPHHLLKLFANLTQEDLQNYIREGEQATWPRIERVRYQTRISRTLEDCLLLLKQRVLERAQPKISRLRARA